MGTLGIRSFGSEPPEENEEDVLAMFRDEEPGDLPAEDEPEAQPAPVEPLPPETDESEEPPAAPEGAQASDDAEDVERAKEELLAGKFHSVSDLERAYQEVTSGFTRVAQENAQVRQFAEQLQAQQAQQEQQMAQVVEYLQAQMAEQDPEFAEELQRRLEMQQLVDERVAPYAQQQQQQQQLDQNQRRMAAAADDFYRRHADVVPGSPEDVAMTQNIVRMMNAGVRLDLGNPEHLDLALEAAGNDGLTAELMMAPAALEVPGGVARLRQRAGATIAPTEAAPGENGTTAKAPVRQRVEAHVEVGTGGAPQSGAPGRQPDEFDEAWEWYQGRSAKGPIFGAKTG